MRYLLSLAILLSLCLRALSQQYQYVPTTAYPAMWQVVNVRSQDDSAKLTRTCTQINYQFTMGSADTLRNGQYWKMITMRQHKSSYTTTIGDACKFPDTKPKVATYTEDVYTFFREDNKVAYEWSLGSNLFDFNAGVGTNSPQSGLMQEVVAIDTIAIDGGLRRRYITQYDTVIEGIGALRGGLVPIFLGPSRLTCFESNGKIIYQDPEYPCGVIFPFGTPTNVSNIAEPSGLLAYPNPFIDRIHIGNLPAGSTARLYNSVGQLVARSRPDNAEIQTSSLPAGVYFLILKNNDGEVIHSQKLVKQ